MCLQHYAAGNKCKIPSLFPGSVVSCSRGRKVQTLETRLSIHFFSPLFLSSAFLLLFFSFFLPSFFPSFVSCFLCPLSQVVSRVLCPVSCFLPYFHDINAILLETASMRERMRMHVRGHSRSPEAALLLVSTKNCDLWPGPTTFRF